MGNLLYRLYQKAIYSEEIKEINLYIKDAVIDFDQPTFNCIIKSSNIHGKGCFAPEDLEAGSIINVPVNGLNDAAKLQNTKWFVSDNCTNFQPFIESHQLRELKRIYTETALKNYNSIWCIEKNKADQPIEKVMLIKPVLSRDELLCIYGWDWWLGFWHAYNPELIQEYILNYEDINCRKLVLGY